MNVCIAADWWDNASVAAIKQVHGRCPSMHRQTGAKRGEGPESEITKVEAIMGVCTVREEIIS